MDVWRKCRVALLQVQHLEQISDVLGSWRDEGAIIEDLRSPLQMSELLESDFSF